MPTSHSAGRATLIGAPRRPATAARQRTLLTLAAILACVVAIGAQLLRLAVRADADLHLNLAEPIGQSWSRPDIVDRHGQLLATDVAANSLYVDPQAVLDVDEVVEKISSTLGDLDRGELSQIGRAHV